MRSLLPVALLAHAVLAGCSGGFSPPASPFSDLTPDQRKSIRDIMHPFQDRPGDVSEPVVDVTDVAVGRTESPNGDLIGVGVKTAGGTPDGTEYSSYCGIDLTDKETDEEKRIVTQHHDNVSEVILEGFPAPDVTVQTPPWGFFILFRTPDGWKQGDILFDLDCGFMQTDTSPFIQETLDDAPVDLKTTKVVEDILAEIEEVFVPS